MKNILQFFLLLVAASAIAACGVKGHLKTPEQIERDQAKKAKKAEGKKAQAEDRATEDEEQPQEKK